MTGPQPLIRSAGTLGHGLAGETKTLLTESRLREVLTLGHETPDAKFIAHVRENLPRAAYLMAHVLSHPEHPRLDSTELTSRIMRYLASIDVVASDSQNPVAWFSAEWTNASNGHKQHFLDEYFHIFVREETSPITYSIVPSLREMVAKILLELGPPLLTNVTAELAHEGAFTPATSTNARRWDLHAVVVRQGRPQFRAALLKAYGGRCAITKCDRCPRVGSRPHSAV